jgi:hypothetical protein
VPDVFAPRPGAKAACPTFSLRVPEDFRYFAEQGLGIHKDASGSFLN